ncbi:uncharacterized protein H6S33_004633 [Morchella sextelata]|uniref:uncharacterized protein n=1 Tax=Morchella sextelata TaxID=1174677 RepID=UPI001D04F15A|nr:uncharacterized protein H6S33_004633 [Morchella sextelata]KAH0605411.1 hypothetical protein H6S33_004633 [Morchella sextelata]
MSDAWADSLSEDWISQPRDSPPPPPSTRILHESSTTNRRPTSSTSSTGTENIRSSSGKDTPEWKRMVMEDFRTPGGKDLFSPMPLECMFRPPTIGGSPDPIKKRQEAEQRWRASTSPEGGVSTSPERNIAIPRNKKVSCAVALLTPEGTSDRKNENWSSIRALGDAITEEAKNKEDILDMVDRLRMLKDPGSRSFGSSPVPGSVGVTLASDSQYLPMGSDEEGSEAADTVPELGSAPPTVPRRRKSLDANASEISSVYPSSPPVLGLGYQYDSEAEDDDYDASYLDASGSGSEDDPPFVSPLKQYPPAEELARRLQLASPFLPSSQDSQPPNLEEPSKRAAPALPPQGEPLGYSILDNIRRHKDAPKSPVKPTPPNRDDSASPDEREDPFFTPHAFRHQLLDIDLNGGNKTRTSGSPLKLFASFYDTYTNKRLTQRLGELETSANVPSSDDDEEVKEEEQEESVRAQEIEEAISPTTTDISFSGAGASAVVNRLEKLVLKQEKRRARPAEPQRHGSAPEVRGPIEEGHRKHRRWRSDESGTATAAEDTSSRTPVKERTPKRVRRNINGVYNQRGPSSGVPPVPGPLGSVKTEEVRAAECVTPTGGAKRKDRKVPVLKKNYEYGDNLLSPGACIGPRKDLVVFSGSYGDGAEGEPFEMPSPMQPETVRKGSVTTQDFLDQADAVMNRIRDRGLHGVALDFQSPDRSQCDDGSSYDDSSVRRHSLSPLRNEVENSHEGSFNQEVGTTKTAVSTSSRKSAVEVISPRDGVMSHHLALKNNGMRFDEKKMMWVKRDDDGNEVARVEDSDPFTGISDLSVDSQEEARALELARRNWEGMTSDGEKSGLWPSSRMMGIDEEDEEDGIGDETWDRQQWFGDQGTGGEEGEGVVGSTVGSGSSERSCRSTRPGSGAETRTTSYGSDENKEKLLAVEEEEDDETEEIKRVSTTSAEPLRTTPRNVYAEDYESPTAMIRQEQHSSSPGGHPVLWTDEGDSTTDGGAEGYGALRKPRRNVSRTFSGVGYRGAARRKSSGARTFIGRPISRITEEEEDDGHHHQHHGHGHGNPILNPVLQRELSRISMSSALTPLPSPFISKMSINNSIRKVGDISFQMTPLADLSYQFETTDALINLELSFFATRKGKAGTTDIKSVEASFSTARANLLKNLTDVQPYEPYWDHMKVLDLSKRKVETLFTLNEWCPRLEKLDVSDNELGQLSGVSDSVRELKVAGNFLSSITHFGHLVNLQYLDVSRNGLESLDGLRSLVHLREVRADDNVLESVEGVVRMEGLCVLRARRNRLVAVDFGKARMHRLTELDLRGNAISDITGLQNLPALINLNLDQNNLDTLHLPAATKMDTIRCIKLTQNYFTNFDVTPFPNLRILYMDNNRLHTITGLTRAKHLDAISVREQDHELSLKLERMYEARKIYMSGNPLRELSLKLDFLNLQYLELASAQLTVLPKDFGELLCNTRVLNLNNNAISDLKPLLGIIRLKKLLLVGNRVRSVKKIASVLSGFPSLSYLDLRMNPLTIGFYPPSSVRKAIQSAEDPDEYAKDPFTMMPADESVDATFQAQLDIDSAVVRRTYEITIGRRCPRMKELDGLTYNKEGSMREDEVWAELGRRGLVKIEPKAVER